MFGPAAAREVACSDPGPALIERMRALLVTMRPSDHLNSNNMDLQIAEYIERGYKRAQGMSNAST